MQSSEQYAPLDLAVPHAARRRRARSRPEHRLAAVAAHPFELVQNRAARRANLRVPAKGDRRSNIRGAIGGYQSWSSVGTVNLADYQNGRISGSKYSRRLATLYAGG